MARNQHKKDLINLAEAYGSVLNGGHDEREQLNEVLPAIVGLSPLGAGVLGGAAGLAAGKTLSDDEERAADVELDHWWDFDPHNVMIFVHHGKFKQLPPKDPEDYEENYEKIFTWLNKKWPRPAEDGEFNLRDVNPGDTLFGDRRGKREEGEEDKTGHLNDKALLHKVEGMGTAGDRLLDSAKKRVGAGESLTDSERTALARDAYGKAEKDIAHDKKSEDFEDTTHGY